MSENLVVSYFIFRSFDVEDTLKICNRLQIYY